MPFEGEDSTERKLRVFELSLFILVGGFALIQVEHDDAWEDMLNYKVLAVALPLLVIIVWFTWTVLLKFLETWRELNAVPDVVKTLTMLTGIVFLDWVILRGLFTTAGARRLLW